MKNCSMCKQNKDISLFSIDKRSGSARSYCKACRVTIEKNRRSKNPEYYLAMQKRWRDSNPLKVKENNLKKSVGISLSDYQSMHESQKGVCAVCKKLENTVRSGKLKNLAVDHDHATGKIRGLLCQKCNQALGLLKEDFDAILNLAKYVQEHKNVI